MLAIAETHARFKGECFYRLLRDARVFFASFSSPPRRILGYFRQVPAGLIFSDFPTTCAILIATC
jgi:hypothetical protein